MLFIAVIVLIEFAAGLFIYSQFASRTYKREYASYQEKSDTLAAKIFLTHQSYENIESDEEELSAILSDCRADGQFDYYFVFREASGEILASDGLLGKGTAIGDQGLKYNAVSVINHDGKAYVFSPSELGQSGYRIGCLKDFSESRSVIDNVLGNVIATLVVAGVLIAVTFSVYAHFAGNKEKSRHFRYRVTVDKEGKVLTANKAFKDEFSSVKQINSFDKLDQKGFNLVNLSGTTGERLVAMRVKSHPTQSVLLAGEVSNADSFIQSDGEGQLDADGKATTALSKVFENFLTKGKRTLLGVLFISNLDRIKTLFGKQMAIDIQHIVLKKAREKFNYAYELDFGYLGVTFPDGKKLDNLLADLEDVHRYINSPIKMDDNLFTVELKSGFAMCDNTMSPLDFEHAYKAAEAARQRAIDTNIADYIIYHESQRKLYTKYFITYDIKQMLSEGAFEMEYQPQYNIKEERIEGFEALFRVKKSWNVNVDTFSFITYAERTGAMVQLGDFIFDTGMQFAKKLEGKNVSVSLNVSPVQLMQAGFTENFLRLYKKYNLKPRSICVEITESFLMTNFTETLKKLDILTSYGIDVHLDDFGTEYSSLLYIKKLPISTIKIDKEFVKDVLTSKESQAIIKFITNIAKLLNRTTICEGVETTQEFDMLNYLGCDTIQGWLIGKSMKPEAALEIVDTFDYKRVVAASANK